MFNIGDKIVYPTQGIGEISSVEEKVFKGEKQPFYEIKLFNSTMKSALPNSRVKSANIRLVSSDTIIDSSLSSLNKYITDIDELTNTTSKLRMISNNIKIKSGSLHEYLGIISDLTQIKHFSRLNATETQVLKNVTAFVVGEISISKNLSRDEATLLLDNAVSLSI